MMLFLVLGPMLEEKYGSSNILLVVGTTALVTGIVNTIIGTAGLLGASGVIFAFIILASMTSFRRGEIPLTLILVVVLYIGKEIVNGLNATDNISQLAHIGGGLTGGLLGYYIASKNEDAIK
jgi:membrane associated rhomboid family serine protease